MIGLNVIILVRLTTMVLINFSRIPGKKTRRERGACVCVWRG